MWLQLAYLVVYVVLVMSPKKKTREREREKNCCHLRNKYLVYVRVKKIRRYFITVRHTKEDLLLYLVNLKLGINLRIIVINLIIVNLFKVCPVVFLFNEKWFFQLNICVIMCDYYFELIILVIILFRTQQFTIGPLHFTMIFFEKSNSSCLQF